MTFLRPEWFLALIPLLLLALLQWRRKRGSRAWASVIDSRLLPHLLSEKPGRRSATALVLWLFVATLAIVALAGPAWQKLSQPVFKQQGALIIALDLSVSMNAADVRPSRLERARLKLIDLLQRRKEGQTALIAYAAAPFTVTPLTDDFGTILSLLPSLTTDIMPAQGSRADLAVAKAIELLDNAGLKRGDILLVTDAINDTSLNTIAERHMPGIRVSLLGVGTEHGAPARTASGEFVKDRGSIVVARSNFDRMADLARAKSGLFQVMSINDSDILAIENFVGGGVELGDHQQTEFEADQWREEGPWLLLLVTPLAALAFRRGVILPMLLAAVLLPSAGPAEAAPEWWERLWRNPDQLGKHRLEQGQADQAAQLFRNPSWKAAAHYRAGDYEQSLQQLQNPQSADDYYNRGNALAKLDKLEDALNSYDQALEKNPEHLDAAHNRELVKQALEQQQQEPPPQDSSEPQEKDENEEQQEQEEKQQQQEGEQQEKEQDEQGEDQPEQKDDGKQEQKGDQKDEQKQGDQSDPGEQDQQSSQQNKDQQQQESASRNDEQGNPDQPAPDQQQSEQEKPVTPDQAQQQQQAGQHGSERDLQQLDPEQIMTEQAEKQWLRRIPDDPGGLLRNKFRFQYSRQRSAQQEKEPW